MRKFIFILFSMFSLMVFAEGIPHKPQTDIIVIGRGNANDPKQFIYDSGLGGSNPILQTDAAGLGFSFNKPLGVLGDLTIGDGTATDQKIIMDIGAGASNPLFKWDNALNKITLSNDGAIFSPISTEAAENKDSTLLNNAGLLVTAAANAMTIALKQSDGSTDATSLSPVKITFRDSSDTSGALNIRAIESSLSLTIPDGATLGTANAVESRIYLYALDNAGTVELAVGNIRLEGSDELISTTILNTSSDDNNVLYSAVARTNVSVRIIGFFKSTQATAGVWASSPTLVGVGNHTDIRVETCKHDGQASPVTQSTLCDGWIDSLSSGGTGITNITYTSGVFSEISLCTCTTVAGDGGQICDTGNLTVSGFSTHTRDSNATLQNRSLTFTCIGRR